MKNNNLLLAYQEQLIYGCVDDYSAIAALSGYLGNLNGQDPLKWAHAVTDFLYLNHISGLIEVFQPENYPFIDDLKDNLMQEMDSNGQITSLDQWAPNWMAMLFYSTQKTHDLTTRYGLKYQHMVDQPIHPVFMNTILKIYSDFDTLTLGCDEAAAHQRIAVAKRVIHQLTNPN